MGTATVVRAVDDNDRCTLRAERIFRGDADPDLPRFLVRFLRPGDKLTPLAVGRAEVLVERYANRGQPIQLLYATVGYASLPKERDGQSGFVVRAELPHASMPKMLLLSGEDIQRYSYLRDGEANRPTLYDLLQVLASASLADLRVAWRVRSLELGASPAHAAERAKLERAFNILAHPDLRNCYDTLCRDEDAPPLFPYGGFGSILVKDASPRTVKCFSAIAFLRTSRR